MLPQATHPYGPPDASSNLTLQQYNQAKGVTLLPSSTLEQEAPLHLPKEHHCISSGAPHHLVGVCTNA